MSALTLDLSMAMALSIVAVGVVLTILICVGLMIDLAQMMAADGLFARGRRRKNREEEVPFAEYALALAEEAEEEKEEAHFMQSRREGGTERAATAEEIKAARLAMVAMAAKDARLAKEAGEWFAVLAERGAEAEMSASRQQIESLRVPMFNPVTWAWETNEVCLSPLPPYDESVSPIRSRTKCIEDSFGTARPHFAEHTATVYLDLIDHQGAALREALRDGRRTEQIVKHATELYAIAAILHTLLTEEGDL